MNGLFGHLSYNAQHLLSAEGLVRFNVADARYPYSNAALDQSDNDYWPLYPCLYLRSSGYAASLRTGGRLQDYLDRGGKAVIPVGVFSDTSAQGGLQEARDRLDDRIDDFVDEWQTATGLDFAGARLAVSEFDAPPNTDLTTELRYEPGTLSRFEGFEWTDATNNAVREWFDAPAGRVHTWTLGSEFQSLCTVEGQPCIIGMPVGNGGILFDSLLAPAMRWAIAFWQSPLAVPDDEVWQRYWMGDGQDAIDEYLQPTE